MLLNIAICFLLATFTLVNSTDDHVKLPNVAMRTPSPEKDSEPLIDWSTVHAVPKSQTSAPKSSSERKTKTGFLNVKKLTDEQIKARNRAYYSTMKNDPKKLAKENERMGMRYHIKQVEKLAKEKNLTQEETIAELEKRKRARAQRKESRQRLREGAKIIRSQSQTKNT